MGVSISHQAFVFLGSVVLGLALGFLYDIFRIRRMAFPSGALAVALQDVLFWSICTVLLFGYMFSTNSGELRWFIIFGAGSGALVYTLTLGVLIMKSARCLVDLLQRVLRTIWRVISPPFIKMRQRAAERKEKKALKRKKRKENLQNPFQNAGKHYTMKGQENRLERRIAKEGQREKEKEEVDS